MLFKSKYKSLSVWFNDSIIEFKNGEYDTDKKREISFLKNIPDVTFEEEPDDKNDEPPKNPETPEPPKE